MADCHTPEAGAPIHVTDILPTVGMSGWTLLLANTILHQTLLSYYNEIVYSTVGPTSLLPIIICPTRCNTRCILPYTPSCRVGWFSFPHKKSSIASFFWWTARREESFALARHVTQYYSVFEGIPPQAYSAMMYSLPLLQEQSWLQRSCPIHSRLQVPFAHLHYSSSAYASRTLCQEARIL